MLVNTWRRLVNRKTRDAGRVRGRTAWPWKGSFRPGTELLEDRLVLSTVSWDGGGGNFDWNNALNWSTDALPGVADDVVINAATASPITHALGTTSVHSLQSQAAITLSGGTLSLDAASEITNAF